MSTLYGRGGWGASDDVVIDPIIEECAGSSRGSHSKLGGTPRSGSSASTASTMTCGTRRKWTRRTKWTARGARRAPDGSRARTLCSTGQRRLARHEDGSDA